MHGHFGRGCGSGFLFAGRHRGRGFGFPFGGGGPGFGGEGFRTARRLAAGDLQLVVLALLAEQPRHGYEIIKAIEERSHGFYAPSPGMIYPALTYLEEIGHATVEAKGTRKLYRITPAGLAHFEANRAAAETMLDHLARAGRKLERVRQFFAGEEDDAWQDPDLAAARRELKAALTEKTDASAEERARIAAILRDAVAAIRRPRDPA